MEKIEFDALDDFAPLLINGDINLSDEDDQQLENFCQTNGMFLDRGYFSCDNDDPCFGKCEVTEKYGRVRTYLFILK